LIVRTAAIGVIQSALAAVEAERQFINDLNVYPVPDGDTGTNMALTVRAVVEELEQSDVTDIPSVAAAVTKGSLMGARGNSGVILSQIVRGICDVWGRANSLDTAVFKQAVVEGQHAAYRAVKTLGLEDFTSYPPPKQGGSLIPLSQAESRKKSAEVYANAAIQDFRWRHPFLSKILKVRPDIPSTLVDRDVNDFFATHRSDTYPMVRAIDIATAETRKNLQTQTERIVPIARTILVILFFLMQLLPFGIIGYAAYTDLKVTT